MRDGGKITNPIEVFRTSTLPSSPWMALELTLLSLFGRFPVLWLAVLFRCFLQRRILMAEASGLSAAAPGRMGLKPSATVVVFRFSPAVPALGRRRPCRVGGISGGGSVAPSWGHWSRPAVPAGTCWWWRRRCGADGTVAAATRPVLYGFRSRFGR